MKKFQFLKLWMVQESERILMKCYSRAASTCYSITLAAMLERNDIPLEHLKVDAKGVVDVTKGIFTYEKITYHVAMKLTKASDEVKAIKLAKRAESSCMISRAIQGNIELETIIRIDK